METNTTSRAMGDALISGKDSERQTTGVKSTLANALKRISTQNIFQALSADEDPPHISNPENPTVILVVYNPKLEHPIARSLPLFSHTIIKQMSVRKK